MKLLEFTMAREFHHYIYVREVCIIMYHKPLAAMSRNMWQCYFSGYSASSYKYTNAKCASYISLAQTYTLQTGYPAKTKKKSKARKLKEWGKT